MDNESGSVENPPQVPPNQQLLLPNFQVQIPMPGQQPPSNVQILVETIKESTKEGNSSEAQVAQQIILISAAILAVVGGFAFSSNEGSFNALTTLLLMITVVCLGGSLFSGVVHFIMERQFWYGNRQKGIAALNIVKKVSTPLDQENSALQALSELNEGSKRVAFWFQIASFVIGIITLLVLISAVIISKAH